jgi:hypothetical protein
LTYDYYEFISEGKKGSVTKAILFLQDENRPFVYHCVMGDVQEDKSIDAGIITNNGDMKNVLSTVVDSTILFLSQYPDCHVLIKGSNKARTRLYRMAINAIMHF